MRISDWSSDVCSSDLPDFQGMLRSQMTVADSIEIDLMLRGVDDLPKPYTPGYVEADVRLGWKLGEGMELFALGTNLLHKQHRSEENTSELHSLMRISYDVFCLKKKIPNNTHTPIKTK